MKRSWIMSTAVLTLSALTMAGVALAANRPIPDPKPDTVFQSEVPDPLPGDQSAWKQALDAPSPVRYRVLVIDDTDGEDRTDYLDRMAEKWGLPAADQLYLVIFTKANYDLRFYMGANFRAKGVTVDEMLTLVRTHYFVKSQKGDVAGGLADLVNAVNRRMGGGAVTDKTAQAGTAKDYLGVTVPDPLQGGPRWSAAMEVQFVKEMMTAYLNQFVGDDVPEAERLKAFRIHEDQIYPLTEEPSRMVFHVIFDVQPFQEDSSAWMAGNGVRGEDGWITSKTIFLTTVKNGTVWTIEALSTSP